MSRVIQVAPSRHNRGGISSILKRWEAAEFWDKYKIVWIETQDNRGVFFKCYYLLRSYSQAVYWIPRSDIAHFHTIPGRSILVQMPIFLLALLFKKKIVVQLHVGNQLMDHIDDVVFKWVLHKANKIVVLAYVWRDLLLDSFKLSEEKVAVVYNAAPDVKEIDYKDSYVLFMAYLKKNKGYDVIIKAFSQIAKEYPDWKLVIAGAGEIEKAKALVKQCGAYDSIVIKGWVDGEERENLLRHAGVYCMASFQEGFPMTVLEAWSYGIPLVTTPVGGLPDVIKHEENAMVFDFGDVSGLEKCLTRLFSSKKLRESLSEASIELAKDKFSMRQIVMVINNMYDRLCGY